jgi:hypothetical protein
MELHEGRPHILSWLFNWTVTPVLYILQKL